MSDEDKAVAAAATDAAEVIESADTVEKSGADTTEKPEGEQERPKKDGTQKRIDRLTREKYELKAKADMLERMLQSRGEEPQGKYGLDRNDFATEQEYLDALVEQKLAEKELAKEAQRKSAKVQEILDEVEDLVEDFDMDDWKDLPITPAMAEAIIDSDYSAKLSAYLYEHPAEVRRIADLPRARQAAAIGKIEAKLEAESETKKKPPKTSAPEPIKPVAAGKSVSSGYRSDFTLAEYQRWRKGQS